MTELNLVDKLVLLALDDDKGNFVADNISLNYALAGAAIFELTTKEKITVASDKLKVKSPRKLNEKSLDYCLEQLAAAKKEKTTKSWIETLGNRGKNIRKLSVEKLIDKRILQEKEDKILWIFPTTNYPTKNAKPENDIRAKLKDIILRRAEANTEEFMLISLVESCGLNKEVYGKDFAKEHKQRIKQMIKESGEANSTNKMVKEIHETIMVAIIISISASPAATSAAIS